MVAATSQTSLSLPVALPLVLSGVSLMGLRARDPMAMMQEFLREAGGCAVIDGGLATELEANGANLKDALWSAKCLFTSPDLIKKANPLPFLLIFYKKFESLRFFLRALYSFVYTSSGILS